MAIIFIKKAEVKQAKFIEILEKKLGDSIYNDNQTNFSVTVIPDTSDKPIMYAHGITNVTQLCRTVVQLHKRKSSILVVGSRFIKPSTINNSFPPYVMKTNHKINDTECSFPIFMPISHHLGDIYGSSSASYGRTKQLRNECSVVNIIKSFRMLSVTLVDELKKYYNNGTLVFMDKSYGMKIVNENKMTQLSHGVLYSEVNELYMGTIDTNIYMLPLALKKEINPLMELSRYTTMNGIVKKNEKKESPINKLSTEVFYTDTKKTARKMNIIEKNPFLKKGVLVVSKEIIEINIQPLEMAILEEIDEIFDNYITVINSFDVKTSTRPIQENEMDGYEFFTIEDI